MEPATPLYFTAAQLQIIDRALQQQPYGLVAPLIADINAQLAKLQQTEQDANV